MSLEEEKNISKIVKENGHLIVNGCKGIWTLDEVVKMLVDNNLKIKLSMDIDRKLNYILPSTKDSDRVSERNKGSNLVEMGGDIK